jgi:hypothetical protein
MSPWGGTGLGRGSPGYVQRHVGGDTAIWEVRRGEGGLGGDDQHKGCLRTLAGHGSPFPSGLDRRSCVSLSHLQLGSGCGSGFADWSLSGSSGGSEEEDPCGPACLHPAMVSLGKRGTCWGCWRSLDTRGELTEDTARRGSGHLPDSGRIIWRSRHGWAPRRYFLSLFPCSSLLGSSVRPPIRILAHEGRVWLLWGPCAPGSSWLSKCVWEY